MGRRDSASDGMLREATEWLSESTTGERHPTMATGSRWYVMFDLDTLGSDGRVDTLPGHITRSLLAGIHRAVGEYLKTQ